RRDRPSDDGLQFLPVLRGAVRSVSRDGDAPRLFRRRSQLSRQSLPWLRRLLQRLPVLPAPRVRRQCAADAPDLARGLLFRLFQAIRDAGELRYLDGGGVGCFNEDDRPTDRRRIFHHLTFYGFGLCFAATCVATLYHYLLAREAPYAWWDLPVVLGTLGGIGLLIGPVGLLTERWKRDPVLVDDARYGMDIAFIVMLFLTSLTGMALLLLRETAAMGPLLALHLGVVFSLFVTMPYGK